MTHTGDSGGVPPPPLLNLLGRVVVMTHTREDQELDYWILVLWTFLCLSRGRASYVLIVLGRNCNFQLFLEFQQQSVWQMHKSTPNARQIHSQTRRSRLAVSRTVPEPSAATKVKIPCTGL